jgi:hypothetical protein
MAGWWKQGAPQHASEPMQPRPPPKSVGLLLFQPLPTRSTMSQMLYLFKFSFFSNALQEILTCPAALSTLPKLHHAPSPLSQALSNPKEFNMRQLMPEERISNTRSGTWNNFEIGIPECDMLVRLLLGFVRAFPNYPQAEFPQ